MKFALIHAEKASFPVAALCRLLGVTRQGYYAFAKRQASARVEQEAALCARIRAVHAESFFSTLKIELVHRRRWTNLLQLRSSVFDYIEVFYNRRRLHSSLGYKTPAEVENASALEPAA